MFFDVRKNASETMITKSVNPHNIKGSSPFFPLVSIDSFSPLLCGSDGGRYNIDEAEYKFKKKNNEKLCTKIVHLSHSRE